MPKRNPFIIIEKFKNLLIVSDRKSPRRSKDEGFGGISRWTYVNLDRLFWKRK